MKPFLKRTWVEINLDAIRHNYDEIRDNVNPKSKIMCVVKADAYGHGAIELATEYEQLGADWLAVSNIEEALQLRKANIKLPILILGYTPPKLAVQLADNNISQAVVSLEYAKELSKFAMIFAKTVNIHVKIDTGMSRIGLLAQNSNQINTAVDEIAEITSLKNIFVEGLFTHFSSADGTDLEDKKYTRQQFSNFAMVIYELRQRNIKFNYYHCANSASVCCYPKTHINMVRPGIILYGLDPLPEMYHNVNLKIALTFKTAITQIKTVPVGTSVSYGRKFTTNKITKIATVPVGYADGYPRRMSNKGIMAVNGHRVNVIGTVCMDQLMLDVSNVDNINVGDEVIIFGDGSNNSITIDQFAGLNNTISYEVLCNISKRVPRIYYRYNKMVDQLNYIDP